MEHKTVFISYRRSQSKHLGRSIYQDLKMNGYDCFFDVEGIDSGQFDQIILNQIAARAHFVLIISDGSLVRCQNAGDWVLREIQEAVRLGRNIIPVIDEGADFTRELSYLPADLAAFLGKQNNLPLPHFYFEAGMAALRTRYLKQPVVGAISPTPTREQPAVQRFIAAADAEAEIVPRTPPKKSRYTAELVVDVRGRGDYTRISDALEDAPAGARIVVKPGTYLESLKLTKTVTLEGEGGRDRVIVQSDSAECLFMDTDEAWVLGIGFRCVVRAKNVKCYGIDIPKGRLTLSECSVTSDFYASIAIHNPTAKPYIVDCLIHDGENCGIYTYDNGTGMIEDCQIYGNTVAGIFIAAGSNLTIRHCALRDGDVGILLLEKATGVIEDCQIYGNKSEGIEIATDSSLTVRSCNLHNNQTGVSLKENGIALIEDCQIYGNTHSGIAIKTGGNPTVRRCTITQNGFFGVYARQDARGTVERCDLRGNTKGAWLIKDTSQITRRDNQE